MVLKPLNPNGSYDGDGDPELDDLHGCHSGTSFGLNITNPQPGFIYKWPRNTTRDINYYRRLGYTVVKAEDPEWSVGSKTPGDMDATPLDSSDIYNDVILMRAPEEAVRQQVEREQAKTNSQLRSGAEEFVSQANPAEIAASGGLPSRFAKREHRMDYRAGDSDQSPLVRQWTPDRGIVDDS
jgi:hypothetical protein